jgi:hypothetical protein
MDALIAQDLAISGNGSPSAPRRLDQNRIERSA